MPRPRRVVQACALAVMLPALVCPPLTAEVKTRVRADGTIEIYNDGPGGSPLASRPRRPNARAPPPPPGAGRGAGGARRARRAADPPRPRPAAGAGDRAGGVGL